MLEYKRIFLKRSPRFPHPLYGEGFKKLLVQNLSFTLNQKEIFSNINLEIKKNDFSLIIGENGIGKTTLLKMFNNQLTGYSGEIILDGMDIRTRSNRELASRISYLPQKIVFSIPYTVLELLEMSAYSSVVQKEQAVQEALELFQIENLQNKVITKLSGGEIQRVLLASTYVVGGELMLLDEPFSFLDPGQRQKVWEKIVVLHNTKQRTMVIVVNSIEEIKMFKDIENLHIYVIKDNKILQFAGFTEKFKKVFANIFQVEIR